MKNKNPNTISFVPSIHLFAKFDAWKSKNAMSEYYINFGGFELDGMNFRYVGKVKMQLTTHEQKTF